MFRRIAIYISTALLMVSCYTFNKPEKPKHLLSKKEMVNIILDLRILASANGLNQKKLEEHGIYSEAYVYEKYKTDSSTFASSNNYYAFYLDDYNEIYDKVKDSLEQLKNEYDELVKKEIDDKRKQDSISRIRKRDSIAVLRKIDSLRSLGITDSLLIKEIEKEKPKLIEPVVSETSPQ